MEEKTTKSPHIGLELETKNLKYKTKLIRRICIQQNFTLNKSRWFYFAFLDSGRELQTKQEFFIRYYEKQNQTHKDTGRI